MPGTAEGQGAGGLWEVEEEHVDQLANLIHMSSALLSVTLPPVFKAVTLIDFAQFL